MFKTARTDIDRNQQKTICPNSSMLGYSTRKLRCGDLFLYTKRYTRGATGTRLAKCHGRVKPYDADDKWMILAQTASDNMQFTYERWVEPEDVIEIVTKDRTNIHVMRFFEEKEDSN